MKIFSRTSLLLVLALACAHSVAEAQTASKPRRDRNRISAEELRASAPTTVYDFVRSKRSHWLSTRGQASLETRVGRDVTTGGPMTFGVEPAIVVYIDNVRNGTHEALKGIRTDDVESLEYLDSSTATQQFGTGHPHGAIFVRLRVR